MLPRFVGGRAGAGCRRGVCMYSGRVECIPRAACLWRAVVSVVWWQGSPLAVVSSWRAQCKCLIMRCLLVSGALIVRAAGDSYARAAAITTSTERRSLHAVAWQVSVVVARVAPQLFFKLFKLWDLRGAIFSNAQNAAHSACPVWRCSLERRAPRTLQPQTVIFHASLCADVR